MDFKLKNDWTAATSSFKDYTPTYRGEDQLCNFELIQFDSKLQTILTTT